MWVHSNTPIGYISLGSRLFSMLEISSLTLKQKIIKKPQYSPVFQSSFLTSSTFPEPPRSPGNWWAFAASHEAEPTWFVLNAAKGKHSKGFSDKSLGFIGLLSHLNPREFVGRNSCSWRGKGEAGMGMDFKQGGKWRVVHEFWNHLHLSTKTLWQKSQSSHSGRIYPKGFKF